MHLVEKSKLGAWDQIYFYCFRGALSQERILLIIIFSVSNLVK